MSDLGLLGAYKSGSSDEDAENGPGLHQRGNGGPESSSEESSSSSLDSAKERALAAEARLRDYGEVQGPRSKAQGGDGTSTAAPGKVLPPADAVFNQIDWAEATSGTAEPGTTLRPGAVIEGKAKRYKVEEEAAPVYSDVQVAMLGGHVKAHAGAQEGKAGVVGPVGPTAPPGLGAAPTKVRTKPEAFESFLDKGLGGQQLPRKNQDRKEREKMKREKGQSTHKEWKSEAEMALRQQYD
ncbi:hypothetical protein DUNSADRAFT_7977 [Dunaliella salina]|uniref:Uncharacterized protein n=1 Tax=Dunaliella salina TaxID=3046 RepID=A0ABQ7H637_DUNSA|nr:hypothetical protein DUNSADRAFT_7977 [Dunaliella salina]|eukprot:KAF5842324.1 hypothetical protein DUNSADRAFT_7977 [Dunaliella salina]